MAALAGEATAAEAVTGAAAAAAAVSWVAGGGGSSIGEENYVVTDMFLSYCLHIN
jgi:hypothetical protein